MRNILIAGLLCCYSYSIAQPINLSDYNTTTATTIFQRVNNAPEFYTEATPWVIMGGWHQYFFTTHFTAMWSAPRSLANPYTETIQVGNSSGYGPNWILASSHWWGHFYDPAFLNSPSYIYNYEWNNYHWRRNYNGVFSGHTFYHTPTAQNIMLAFSHGENKNEKIGNYFYQNTVRPGFVINPNDPSTYSGSYNGVYQDCWEAYFGFLNGNWIPYTAAYNWGQVYLNDLGPIAWPSAGYMKPDNTKASDGLRHPSSIVYNGYVYIYVMDASHDGTHGVKLIRCHVDNVLNPSLYETWSAINGWIPSLPPGFTKTQAASFFNTRGPANTSVITMDMNTTRFAVAKFSNTNEFIAVEDYFDGATVYTAFRFSTDLINWSPRQVFYSSPGWSQHQLRYPVFLNKNGQTNTEIDKDEFYVIGANSSSNGITKIRFKKNEPPPPPPVDPCEPVLLKPVPASNTLVLAKPICPIEDSRMYTIEIYDMVGVKRKTERNISMKSDYPINVTNLETGNYVVHIVQGKNRRVRQIRIDKTVLR